MKTKIPRLMIAGTNSGCGKTTIVCGILSALKQADIQAASCKCGPDYIDPMFHSQVFGIPSQNLDLFFSSKEEASYLLAKNSKDADITVMEGVMGFYDGMQMDDTKASSYDLAKSTKTPVVLIVNCKGMALSVLPIIKGFLEFRPDNTIQGVILNGVTPMTGKMLTEIIERELPIKVYGCVPTFTDFQLASRHLGLVTPYELGEIQADIDQLGKEIAKYISIEELRKLAETAEALDSDMPDAWRQDIQDFTNEMSSKGKKLRVGVAWDKAFCFYYKDNLKLLEELGCELVTFSPITDATLPENINALLLGGGYPELYAKELSANKTMREDVREKLENGLPCLAECGGFMYLHDEMEDEQGHYYDMAGVIKGKATNQKKLVRFGYITIQANEENPYLKKGETIQAHEFHYWDSDNNGETFLAKKPSGKRSWYCGHGTKTMLAGYPHLYYYSNIRLVTRFLSQC